MTIRKYINDSDPSPFMGALKKMSFHADNMGLPIVRLRQATKNGEVELMRAGGIDYVKVTPTAVSADYVPYFTIMRGSNSDYPDHGYIYDISSGKFELKKTLISEDGEWLSSGWNKVVLFKTGGVYTSEEKKNACISQLSSFLGGHLGWTTQVELIPWIVDYGDIFNTLIPPSVPYSEYDNPPIINLIITITGIMERVILIYYKPPYPTGGFSATPQEGYLPYYSIYLETLYITEKESNSVLYYGNNFRTVYIRKNIVGVLPDHNMLFAPTRYPDWTVLYNGSQEEKIAAAGLYENIELMLLRKTQKFITVSSTFELLEKSIWVGPYPSLTHVHWSGDPESLNNFWFYNSFYPEPWVYKDTDPEAYATVVALANIAWNRTDPPDDEFYGEHERWRTWENVPGRWNFYYIFKEIRTIKLCDINGNILDSLVFEGVPYQSGDYWSSGFVGTTRFFEFLMPKKNLDDINNTNFFSVS